MQTVSAEVSGNIVGASNATSEAGAAAVLNASAELHEAEVLRSEIDAFLSNIRTA